MGVKKIRGQTSSKVRKSLVNKFGVQTKCCRVNIYEQERGVQHPRVDGNLQVGNVKLKTVEFWYWSWLEMKSRLILLLVLKWNTNQNKSWCWSQFKLYIGTSLGIGIEINQYTSIQVLVLVSNKIGCLADLLNKTRHTHRYRHSIYWVQISCNIKFQVRHRHQ